MGLKKNIIILEAKSESIKWCTIALPGGLRELKKWEIHGLFQLMLKNQLTDDIGAVE